MSQAQARIDFKNPPPEFRPVPFWFWNDHLDPERLVWQFNQLVEAGMGGAVLHARNGLSPEEYLNAPWFSGIEAVVNSAAQQQKIVWLYDELGWPSGTAAGRITTQFPEFQMIQLKLCDVQLSAENVSNLPGETVAAFVVTQSDPNHGILRRTDGGVSLFPDRIACELISLPVDFEKWQGQRVLFFQQIRVPDTLNYFNPNATTAFLASTHAEYHRRFRSHFGDTITHIFTDEAGMCTRVGTLGWDTALDANFQQHHGYSLIPNLPALFFDTPDCEAVRFDYWSLVTEMFREGFAIPIHEWCETHRILFSGHYVFETPLKESVRQLGSTMPLYEFQGLPGIDILGCDFYSQRFDLEPFSKYLVNIKQAASVVHQLAKHGLLSESHGVGGNAMTIEDMQTVDNFQMALGVTTISQHAPFYSIRGRRKLDCPPIIGWQQPYWPMMRKHSDTVSRTAWLLLQGHHQCDVLMLHPAASMQATFRQFRKDSEYKAEDYILDADLPFESLDKHFHLLSVALLDAQIDFDFGDEEIMAKAGAVVENRLKIGQANYRIVVLPPIINLRESTRNLLRRFSEAGGTILSVGSAPYRVNGRPSDTLADWVRENLTLVSDGVPFFNYSPVIAQLTKLGARKFTFQTRTGQDVPALKIQHRIWGDHEILFVANISRDPVAANLAFSPDFDGHLEEWDLTTGRSFSRANCRCAEQFEIFLEWAPRQARAFVILPGVVEISTEPVLKTEKVIEPAWEGVRNQPNCLVLDDCELMQPSFAGKQLSIFEAQQLLGGKKPVFSESLSVRARFRFWVSGNLPMEGLTAVIELPKQAQVYLNGDAITVETRDWWLDPALKRLALPAVQPGENVLEIAGVLTEATDLQSPILLGDFILETEDNIEFKMKKSGKFTGIGLWIRHGLPFYAGTVTYRAEVKIPEIGEPCRVLLELPGLAGSAEIRVNAKIVDHVLWPPYVCDISAAVTPGKNVLEIEVANTLRNLFGPHFDPDEMIRPGFGDAHYQGKFGQPKRFRDYGLLTPARVLVQS